MGVLRAKYDIEQDTEILTRYWHNKKDAWQNIFVCECCACTNHTRHVPDPPELEAQPANWTALIPDHPPSSDLDFPATLQQPSLHVPMSIQQDYPESDTDAWDWDVLEASSRVETPLPSQPPVTQPFTGNAKGTRLDDVKDVY